MTWRREMSKKKAETKKSDNKKTEKKEEVVEEEQSEQALVEVSKDRGLVKHGNLASDIIVPMGFDDFTEDDLVIPRMSIVQKAGDALERGFTLGWLMSSISNDEVETIRATAMLYKKGQVYFEKPYQAGSKPICRSNDALKPSDKIENPFNDVCNVIKRRRLVPVCEKAKWTKDDKGRNVPPECNFCYNGVFKDEETGMPFFMSFRSTAIKPFRNLLSQLWGMQKPLFSVSALISTEDQTNAYGTFKIPRFSKVEAHSDEEIDELAVMYKSLSTTDLDASFDDERNLADDGEYSDSGDSSFDTDELEGEKF